MACHTENFYSFMVFQIVMPVRKRATSMTQSEKQTYKDVITALINNGSYGRLVSHHTMNHRMHSMGGMDSIGLQRFLPWHRVYLYELEKLMIAVDSSAFIPYWRWTTQRTIPAWLRNFTPAIIMPGGSTISVTRNVGFPPPLPSNVFINSVLSETTFTDFATQLESAHNDVHQWVGGTMNSGFSPADPIFWLHHANIDRLWNQWQNKPSNAGKNPQLSGANRTMDPWNQTVNNVLNIQALNYSYGP